VIAATVVETAFVTDSLMNMPSFVRKIARQFVVTSRAPMMSLAPPAMRIAITTVHAGMDFVIPTKTVWIVLPIAAIVAAMGRVVTAPTFTNGVPLVQLTVATVVVTEHVTQILARLVQRIAVSVRQIVMTVPAKAVRPVSIVLKTAAPVAATRPVMRGKPVSLVPMIAASVAAMGRAAMVAIR
jgi:hypothetical protein